MEIQFHSTVCIEVLLEIQHWFTVLKYCWKYSIMLQYWDTVRYAVLFYSIEKLFEVEYYFTVWVTTKKTVLFDSLRYCQKYSIIWQYNILLELQHFLTVRDTLEMLLKRFPYLSKPVSHPHSCTYALSRAHQPDSQPAINRMPKDGAPCRRKKSGTWGQRYDPSILL